MISSGYRFVYSWNIGLQDISFKDYAWKRPLGLDICLIVCINLDPLSLHAYMYMYDSTIFGDGC